MASSKTHLLVGAASGLVAAVVSRQLHKPTLNPVVSTCVGALFGKLPDWLEPSINNPHHRQLFHSWLAMGTVVYGLKRAYEWQAMDTSEAFLRGLVLAAGGAYLSHLAVDATTARSLPWIGRL